MTEAKKKPKQNKPPKPVPGLGDRIRVEVRATPEFNQTVEFLARKLGVSKNEFFLTGTALASTLLIWPVVEHVEDKRQIAAMLRQQFEQLMKLVEKAADRDDAKAGKETG